MRRIGNHKEFYRIYKNEKQFKGACEYGEDLRNFRMREFISSYGLAGNREDAAILLAINDSEKFLLSSQP